MSQRSGVRRLFPIVLTVLVCLASGVTGMTAAKPGKPRGEVRYLSPQGLHRNPAFSQAAVVTGPVKTVYIGGQDAVDEAGQIVGRGDLRAQCVQVLKNIEVALAAAGAKPEHVIKWNIHVLQGQDARVGHQVFQERWGQAPNPPLITMFFVAGLAHPDFLVEIDAVAVVPEG
jgi:enamine deaminase RidA (YjgF/YER057c/UK114 family)